MMLSSQVSVAWGLLPLLLQRMVVESKGTDVSFPNVTITKLAFGSCHKRKYVNPDEGIVWKAVADTKPDAFLWTGDAVYPPARGVASVPLLETEYQQMLTNDTVGYASFKPPHGIFGTWDDHDYGGNDLGIEMPDKEKRRKAFMDFLGAKKPLADRQGVYNSVEWGSGNKKVKVILLDTRWHRQPHCVPSVATVIPLGAGLSCITRWVTAGLNLPRLVPKCRNPSLLGEEQWTWLEQQVQESDAQVHIVVSSIQVLTTNPVIESWGHFENERKRLLGLLNGLSGLVLLSGDVHYAEILDPTAALVTTKQSFLEVTSSGLTHTCTKPFYGVLCKPLLESFDAHRYREGEDPFYFIKRNFGTIDIDWEKSTMNVNIHNHNGGVEFSTGPRSFETEKLTDEELAQVAPCVDGHLIPLARAVLLIVLILFGLVMRFYRRKQMKRSGKKSSKAKKQ